MLKNFYIDSFKKAIQTQEKKRNISFLCYFYAQIKKFAKVNNGAPT